MKIIINLSDIEVRGIKKYLKAVSPDITPRITKKEIEAEIRGLVNGEICNGAIGDYVAAEIRKERAKTQRP